MGKRKRRIGKEEKRLLKLFKAGKYSEVKDISSMQTINTLLSESQSLSKNISSILTGDFGKLYLHLIEQLCIFVVPHQHGHDQLKPNPKEEKKHQKEYLSLLRHYCSLESNYPEYTKLIAAQVVFVCDLLCSQELLVKHDRSYCYALRAYYNFILNKKNKDYNSKNDIKHLTESLECKDHDEIRKIRSCIYYHDKEYARALTDINGIISQEKDKVGLALAWLIRSMIHCKLGKIEDGIKACNTAVKTDQRTLEDCKKIDLDRGAHYRWFPMADDLFVTLKNYMRPLIAKLNDKRKLSKPEIQFIKNNEDVLESLLFPSNDGDQPSYTSDQLKQVEKRLNGAYNEGNRFKSIFRIALEKSLREKFKLYTTEEKSVSAEDLSQSAQTHT